MSAGPVEELIARANRLGGDPRNTNYAGGNASAKGMAVDPVTAEDVELLWVKGSGGDLGTLTSGRVTVGRFTGSGIELHKVHRFPNVPVRAGSTLRWNVLSLFGGIVDGLRIAVRHFGRIDSVGVDGWGVD